MALTEIEINSIPPESPTDTLLQESEPVYGVLLTPPEAIEPTPHRDEGSLGVSFILSGLFILAMIISLRFRDNVKYILAIVNDLITTKIRQNAFDDTVRETSLMVLLNILWCASAGIIFYCVGRKLSLASLECIGAAHGMLAGMAVASAYTLFLYLAYMTVGWVFTDRSHSELWVKGFAASQSLMAPAFFIIALLAVCGAYESGLIWISALCVFVVVKLAFILKGYRIFFNQISSWVLFLCYLCSLEIVPLVLCYRCVLLLG